MHKHFMRIFIFLLLPSTLALSSRIEISSNKAKNYPSALTSASFVRLRTQNNLDSLVLTILPIGSELQIIEHSPEKSEIGNMKDYWYKVKFQKKTGWVFGSFLRLTHYSQKTKTSLDIIKKRIGKKITFEETKDLYRMIVELKTSKLSFQQSAQLDLQWLKTLQKSLNWEYSNQPTASFNKWIKHINEFIYYAEIHGCWYVKNDLIHQLYDKYKTNIIGDELAWLEAQAPYPGECEGYFPCGISVMAQPISFYLKRFPKGKYAQAAINKIQSFFDNALKPASILQIKELTNFNDSSTREDFNSALAKVIENIGEIDFNEKKQIRDKIQHLKKNLINSH